MSKPLFTLYANPRLTPELWNAFVARCESEGVPPGVKLYELIAAVVKAGDKDPAAVALGQRTSDAKAATARENGKRGGRPPKES
jgi:hypothetical protein